jgi:hypothetical protein
MDDGCAALEGGSHADLADNPFFDVEHAGGVCRQGKGEADRYIAARPRAISA